MSELAALDELERDPELAAFIASLFLSGFSADAWEKFDARAKREWASLHLCGLEGPEVAELVSAVGDLLRTYALP